MERNSSDYKARAEKAETAAAELRQECERLRQCCDDMKQAMAVPSQDLVNAMQKCVSERDALREQLATVTRERDYAETQWKGGCDLLKCEGQRLIRAVGRAEKAEEERDRLRIFCPCGQPVNAGVCCLDCQQKTEAERDAAWKEHAAIVAEKDRLRAANASAERAAAESAKRLEECLDVLRSVEWMGNPVTVATVTGMATRTTCPCCGGSVTHSDDCRLAACLQSTQPKEETMGVDKYGGLQDYKRESAKIAGGESASELVAAEPPGTCQGQEAVKATPAPLPEIKHGQKCQLCMDKLATCYGTYEGVTSFACDDCCGHGGEDGECVPITPPPDPDRGKVVRDAIDKMGCELIHRGQQVWTLSNERFNLIYDVAVAHSWATKPE